MKKLIILFLVVATFFACQQEQQKTTGKEVITQEEYLAKNKLNIPKKGRIKDLTPNQKKLVQDWLEFNAIHENMKLINASTRFAIIEDLGQLAANIDALENTKFPKELEATQIRSRFLVLKTKALKLQDDASDENISNAFIEKEIVAMNTVFRATCYQIEKASKLNIKPEEILGDVLKQKDSTTINSIETNKKATITPKKALQKKQRKAIAPEEIDPEEN